MKEERKSKQFQDHHYKQNQQQNKRKKISKTKQLLIKSNKLNFFLLFFVDLFCFFSNNILVVSFLFPQNPHPFINLQNKLSVDMFEYHFCA